MKVAAMTSLSEPGSATQAAPDLLTAGRRTQLLSFDLYERYEMASRIVRTLRKAPACSVLDVGGYSEPLWPGFESLVSSFLPEADSFVVDLHREPGLKNYAVASGMELPFLDRSFDFVMAQDALEHVPFESRPKFIQEALRVARDFVLLSFPFFTPLNEACDRLVYRFLQITKNVDLPALKEHVEFGLPNLDTVREWIIATGFPFRVWTQGNALVWLNMMMAKNHLWTQGVPELEQELDALFNIHFAVRDYQEPCYRAFVLIAREQAQRKRLADLNGLHGEPLSSADHEGVYSLCRMITGSVSTLEAERRLQHSINLLGGLERHVAAGLEDNHQTLVDRDIRLAEAASQAAHYKNLLEEQQRQRADAETRLAQASSQAAHYKNLVDELGQEQTDANTRLAEAASQAAHYRNLLEEQQHQRA